MPLPRICTVFVIALGMAATTPFWLNPTVSVAQTPNAARAMSEMKLLFVNPTVGNDRYGNGSERSPFKTITQALRVAETNTVILLSPAIYSAASGETFPLQMKPGVTIQGNPNTRGQDIVIKGGGIASGENIAILGADQAGLAGVTITNPNPRGYGLWIESSNPIVVNNSFIGNAQDGISIRGNSTTVIQSNFFSQNGANGISIYGTAAPEVQENVLQNTVVGISMADKATPRLTGNRISQNHDGVVVANRAQPILRNNIVENNQQDGLAAIAQSLPDLGTPQQPGGNLFRGNGRFDIRTGDPTEATATAPLPATTANLPQPSVSVSTPNSPVAANLSESNHWPILSQPTRLPSNPISPLPTTANLPPSRGLPSLPSLTPVTPPLETGAIEIPVPPPDSPDLPLPTSAHPSEVRLLSLMPTIAPSTVQTGAIEIPMPLPDSPTPVRPLAANRTETRLLPSLPSLNPIVPARPIGDIDLLPVPSANIPLGNVNRGNNNDARNVRRSASRNATGLGLRYRVIVEANSENEQNLVRSLIPNAFRTTSKGRVVVQVGAYSDRRNAEEMLQMLNSRGLKATIE